MNTERAVGVMPYVHAVPEQPASQHLTEAPQTIELNTESSTLNGLRLVFSSEREHDLPMPVGTVDTSNGVLNVMKFYDGEPGCDELMRKVVKGRHTWYVAHNLLKSDAPLDTIRGANVEIIAFTNPETKDPVVSLRKIHTQTPNNVAELPSYAKFTQFNTLSESGLRTMQHVMRRNNSIVEIGALWKDGAYESDTVMALYRTAFQDSVKRKEVWFMGVVTKQYKQLVAMFGDKVVQSIGDPVAIEGEGATEEAVIHPVVIEPQTVISTLLAESRAAQAVGDDQTRHGKDMMLWTMLEGLDWDALPEQTSAELRETLYGSTNEAA